MSTFREKAQGRTKQMVGQMIGDEQLVEEGQKQERKAEQKAKPSQAKPSQAKPSSPLKPSLRTIPPVRPHGIKRDTPNRLAVFAGRSRRRPSRGSG